MRIGESHGMQYLALDGQGIDVGVVVEHVLVSETCQLASGVHHETWDCRKTNKD